jgi:hypothetical protein
VVHPEVHPEGVVVLPTQPVWGTTLLSVRFTSRLTSGVLGLLALLHVGWGCGSSLPFRTRRDLADAVVGSTDVPPPGACFIVAGALTSGALLVADMALVPQSLRRVGLLGLAGILSVRGVLGLTGRTALISAGSDSARFVRLDRLVYGPLCLGLSMGSIVALMQSSRRRALPPPR